MKICAECKVSQDLNCFANNKIKPDGKSDKCKACKKVYNIEYYKKTKNLHNPARLARNLIMRNRAKDFIRQLKTDNPCTDCQTKFHFMAMDYDHVNGTKLKLKIFQ